MVLIIDKKEYEDEEGNEMYDGVAVLSKVCARERKKVAGRALGGW